MKSPTIKKYIPVLKLIKELQPKYQKILIPHLKDDVHDILCESIYNCLHSNKLSRQKRKLLKRALMSKKEKLRLLSNKRTSQQKRGQALTQLGGSLGLILSAVLPIVTDLIFKAIRKPK
jgi:hypothetical protein